MSHHYLFSGQHNDITAFFSPSKTSSSNNLHIGMLFHCPVAGFCLTPTEQKQLLRKSGIATQSLSAFEMHELLVAALQLSEALGQRIVHFLNKKFAKELAEAANVPENTFMAMWKTAFASGNYAGLLWVAATRADLSPTAQKSIYGTVHMAMHGTAEEQIHALQRIAELEKENKKLQQRVSFFRTNYKKNERDIQHQQDTIQSLRKETTLLSQRNKSIEDKYHTLVRGSTGTWAQLGPIIEKENEELHTLIHEYKDTIEKLQQSIEKRSQHKKKTNVEDTPSTNILSQSQIKEVILKDTPLYSIACCPEQDCEATPEHCSTCKKRILIVGGIERMEHVYRSLIEGIGWTLDYHDGSLQGGVKNLKKSMQRADIVLCPINCNSHGACIKVKDFAKKYAKQFHMIPNGSVSTISKFLQQDAANVQ